ncbi:MAG: hypothetical protein HY666_03305 [Chloroflexi bacterium]|nr:hypothetical protein [Chloroflexota bacterium]
MAQWIMKRGAAAVRWALFLSGAVSFYGYVIALIAGVWWPYNAGLIATLVIMGLVVGLLNITAKEVMPYLVAAIAVVLIGNFEAFSSLNLVIAGLGDKINDIVAMMAIFTAPAAVVQAVRAGITLAKPGD